MNQPTQEAMQKLWDKCQEFIRDEKVRCDDCIYQTDSIIIAAPQLVYEVAEIVGYLGYDAEDEEGK